MSYIKGMEAFLSKLQKLGVSEGFKDSHLWDLMGAWRGPDCEGNADVYLIKFQTTHKIRKWLEDLGEDLKIDHTLDVPFYTLKSIAEICGEHFANHIYSAQRIIQYFEPEFRVYVEEETPFVVPKDPTGTGK